MALLNHTLKFTGAKAIGIETTGEGEVVATMRLTARKKLSCPHCPFTTTAGYDTRWTESSWRIWTSTAPR